LLAFFKGEATTCAALCVNIIDSYGGNSSCKYDFIIFLFCSIFDSHVLSQKYKQTLDFQKNYTKKEEYVKKKKCLWVLERLYIMGLGM
jgi:hypothetical protein